MSLVQDLEPYLDKTWGVVGNYPGERSDNFLLNSAQAWILLKMESASTEAKALKTSALGFSANCETVAYDLGQYSRYPGTEGDISQDELFAMASLSQHLAWRIRHYGDTHGWSWKRAEEFSRRSAPWGRIAYAWEMWLLRFMDFRPYIRHQASPRRISFLDQILWSIGTLLSPLSRHGDTSGKRLKWIQLSGMWGHYALCDWAIRQWQRLMLRKYPGGLSELFSVRSPEYPPDVYSLVFAKYARKDFSLW